MLNKMGKLTHMTALQYLPKFGQRAQLTPKQAMKLWEKMMYLVKVDLAVHMMALTPPKDEL